MNKITSKIVESIESKFQYHPLLNNSSVVAYYLDKCLSGVDEDSEVMIINDNDNLIISVEKSNDSKISVVCDDKKIVGISDGDDTIKMTMDNIGGCENYSYEPIFNIYSYGTKIVCDELRRINGDVVKTQSLFDFKEVASSFKEKINGSECANASIKPINAIIGERALFSIENNIKRKSKTTSLLKDGITIEAMYDSLYTYIDYEPVKNQSKTL